jgi:cytidine deaminase
MKDISITSVIKEYSIDELEQSEQFIISKAIEATNNSYAPYSKFCVGAALLLENDEIIIGCNQENAAYPSGLCAERTALFSAGAQYPDVPVKALAIAARNENGMMKLPVVPCGACRQVMLETEKRYNHDMRILLYGTSGVYVVDSVKALLPLQFDGDSMK